MSVTYVPFGRLGKSGFIKESYFAGSAAANDYVVLDKDWLPLSEFGTPDPLPTKVKEWLKICTPADFYGTDVSKTIVLWESTPVTITHYFTDGWWLYYALGKDVSSGAGDPYTHTETPNIYGVLPSVMIARDFYNYVAANAADLAVRVFGCQVEEYTLSWEFDKPFIETIKLRGAHAVYTIGSGGIFDAANQGDSPVLTDLGAIAHGGQYVLSITGTAAEYDEFDDANATTATRKYTVLGGILRIRNTLMDIQNVNTDAHRAHATARLCTGKTISLELNVLCADAQILKDFNDHLLAPATDDKAIVLTITKPQVGGKDRTHTMTFRRVRCENMMQNEITPLQVRMTFFPLDNGSNGTAALKPAVTIANVDGRDVFDTWYAYTDVDVP